MYMKSCDFTLGNSGSRRTLNFLMCTMASVFLSYSVLYRWCICNHPFLCTLDDVNAYLDRPGPGGPDCKLNFETMSSTRFMNLHTVDKLQSKTSTHALNVLF